MKIIKKTRKKIIKNPQEKPRKKRSEKINHELKSIVDQVAECGHILFQQDMYEQSLHE